MFDAMTKPIVITLGKMLMFILRLLGKNGSALPGLMVERFYPGFLRSQLSQLEQGVVLVTGTNGKTTTTKSLVYLLEQCGLRVFTNPTGSNFTRGIYASLIKYSNKSGVLDYDIAVLELDEAYSRKFAKLFAPRMVVVLNVMRDQLDRYGEIDKTASMIGETISYATEGAVLNASDRRVRELAQYAKGEVSYFGVGEGLEEHLPTEDDFRGVSLHFSEHPKHHHKRHHKKHHGNGDSGLSLHSVTLAKFQPGSAGFRIGDKIYFSSLGVAGIHNAFNLTAALAATVRLCPDVEPQFVVPTMRDIPAAFGRGEVVTLGSTKIVLALVKNPSGFRQSLESYDADNFDAMAFVINDAYADGRDVSWLWDVDFKKLPDGILKYIAGTRGSDMALRLKYDERPTEQHSSIRDLIDQLEKSSVESAIIFCTYTAMLEIRNLLGARTEVKGMWK